jgi:hypothetical protein
MPLKAALRNLQGSYSKLGSVIVVSRKIRSENVPATIKSAVLELACSFKNSGTIGRREFIDTCITLSARSSGLTKE